MSAVRATVRAAEVLVEVQHARLWMLSAGGGPPYEFYEGMPGDWHALLGELVAAVVAGRYRVERHRGRQRSPLLPWRKRRVESLVAVWETDRGPETAARSGGGRSDLPAARRPGPY